MPLRVIIGSLVRLLQDRQDGLLAAEQEVTEVIADLLPGWRGGWQWDEPDAIQIYNAIDSPAAAAALHLAGFRTVAIHDHRAEAFLSCACLIREVGST